MLISCGSEEGTEETTESEAPEGETTEVIETVATGNMATDMLGDLSESNVLRGVNVGDAQVDVRAMETFTLDYESESVDMYTGELAGNAVDLSYYYDDNAALEAIDYTVSISDEAVLTSTYNDIVADYNERFGDPAETSDDWCTWENDGYIIEVHGYNGEIYISVGE